MPASVPPRPAGDGSDDAAVAAEWQRLEDARIAEERAEASDDAAEAKAHPLPRRRWPWIALVAALLAGMLAAVLINQFWPPAADETDTGEMLE